MKKDITVGDVIGFILFIAFVLAVGFTLGHFLFPPSIMRDDSTTIDPIYVNTSTIEIDIDPNHIRPRLDALDGGKERRWNCDGVIISPYDPSIGKKYYIQPSVIRTIGLETPRKLGYVNCTEIPESLWSITQAPIN